MQKNTEQARMIGVGKFCNEIECCLNIGVILKPRYNTIVIRFELKKKIKIALFTFFRHYSLSVCHGHGS
jgi:hypothetical protein